MMQQQARYDHYYFDQQTEGEAEAEEGEGRDLFGSKEEMLGGFAVDGEQQRPELSQKRKCRAAIRFDEILSKLAQLEKEELLSRGDTGGKRNKEGAGVHFEDDEDEDTNEDASDLTPKPGEAANVDMERRRGRVLLEILETERDYLRDLEIVNNVRPPPLLKANLPLSSVPSHSISFLCCCYFCLCPVGHFIYLFIC